MDSTGLSSSCSSWFYFLSAWKQKHVTTTPSLQQSCHVAMLVWNSVCTQSWPPTHDSPTFASCVPGLQPSATRSGCGGSWLLCQHLRDRGSGRKGSVVCIVFSRTVSKMVGRPCPYAHVVYILAFIYSFTLCVCVG